MKQNNVFKTKLVILSSITGILALLYASSFIFSPERRNTRSSLYSWIDEKTASSINRIVINTTETGIELINKNSQWFVLTEGYEYPARSLRIEDFIGIFTAREIWPLRSNNASSHGNFGLESGQANRISFYGGNTVLLDILTGNDTVFGNEIAVRKYAQNEVRSGGSSIKTYISSPISSWYNLRLFQNDSLGAEDVQRLTVYNEDEIQFFNRNNRTWEVSHSNQTNPIAVALSNPDVSIIESYIRTLLNTEGDNFEGLLSKTEEPPLTQSRIVFQFGDGNIVTVNFTNLDESGRRLATLSGTDYIYRIPSWASGRLFRNISEFEVN